MRRQPLSRDEVLWTLPPLLWPGVLRLLLRPRVLYTVCAGLLRGAWFGLLGDVRFGSLRDAVGLAGGPGPAKFPSQTPPPPAVKQAPHGSRRLRRRRPPSPVVTPPKAPPPALPVEETPKAPAKPVEQPAEKPAEKAVVPPVPEKPAVPAVPAKPAAPDATKPACRRIPTKPAAPDATKPAAPAKPAKTDDNPFGKNDVRGLRMWTDVSGRTGWRPGC